MTVLKYEDEHAVVLSSADGNYRLIKDSGEIVTAPAAHCEHLDTVDIRDTFYKLADRLYYYDEAAVAEQYASSLTRFKQRVSTSGKTCTRCNEFKPLTEFGVRAAATDGLMPICKGCKIEVNAEAYKKRHKD